MSSFDREQLSTDEKWANLISGIFVLCLCLLQMYALQAWLHRHWNSLLHYQHTVAIVALIMYPISCLHYFRRFQKNPVFRFLLVLQTYILLSLMTDLIFR